MGMSSSTLLSRCSCGVIKGIGRSSAIKTKSSITACMTRAKSQGPRERPPSMRKCPTFSLRTETLRATHLQHNRGGEEWPHIDVLACDVEGQLGDHVHEGHPVHAERLDPMFVIPRAQGNPFPLVGPAGKRRESVLHGLEVVLQHPSVHRVLGDLVLIRHVKVSSLVHDTWWAQGAVDSIT